MPTLSRFGQFAGGYIPTNDPASAPVGPQMPTATQGGNYGALAAPAPHGGGVLAGLGMGGSETSYSSNDGTSGASPGMAGGDTATGAGAAMAFDEGGVVPDEQGQDATVDPMSAVKQALSYGRKIAGLPQQFYPSVDGESNGTAEQQSFEDGGEVEGSGGDEGDGGVIPTEGGAQQSSQSTPVNPKAAMAYLSGAGALPPEQAAAMEQRVDPRGAMDPSERKMKAVSAAGSPQAQFGLMQHYRTRFNAYSGAANAAMSQGQLGPAAHYATQAFAHVPTGHSVTFAPTQGGIAVMAQPHAQQQSMYDGGEVMSENIEDRRDEDPLVSDPRESGTKRASQSNRDERTYAASPMKDDNDFGDGPKMKSYADGGEVEDDGNDGVIPTEDTATVTDEEGDGAPQQAEAPEQAQPQQDDATGQPQVLSPQQFKQMLTGGFDKPVEQGWGKYLSGILGAMNPVGSAEAAETLQPPARGDRMDRPQQQPNTTTVAKTPAPAAAPAAEPKAAAQPDRYETTMKRIEAQADKLYPRNESGHADQRRAYIEKMTEKLLGNDNKLDVEDAKNRGKSNDNKLIIEQMREQGRNSRNQNTVGERERASQAANSSKDRNAMLNLVRSTANSLRVANPKITPQEVIKQISQTYNIDPNIVAQGMQPGGGGAGPQGGGQRPAGANMDAAKEGDTRPYTKNGVTKNYTFGSDGMWHLVK